MSLKENSHTSSSWFLIVNPNSGVRNFSKAWNRIQQILKHKEIDFSFSLTQHSKHEISLVQESLKRGFRKIISVGGDGTLHHVVNGIMTQRYVKTSEIKLGVIPMGTGNDWIKTYQIPNSIEKSIDVLVEDHTEYQDIGLINHTNNQKEYYINVAGIGYDGYVVNKLNSLKKFGPIAYLLSGLYGLLFYKKTSYQIKINDQLIEEKCLMVLFGLCQYSGGGMQMTQDPDPKDGLLDITIAKNFSFFDLVFNLPKLYNGQIVNHKKVINYKATSLEIQENKEQHSYIEADGELLGKGSLNVSIIPNAIQIIIPATQ
ncbi:diacylglycerol/lipid kinase family protein [Pseudotenacibaculum haliotis]|uniref:Diacylglycerol/lipid kinase family protein n=1 Tax=Pseudotenacibaculum haliotis TaxID=1862138 RepID=A0ABW5LQR7_9FLAO